MFAERGQRCLFVVSHPRRALSRERTMKRERWCRMKRYLFAVSRGGRTRGDPFHIFQRIDGREFLFGPPSCFDRRDVETRVRFTKKLQGADEGFGEAHNHELCLQTFKHCIWQPFSLHWLVLGGCGIYLLGIAILLSYPKCHCNCSSGPFLHSYLRCVCSTTITYYYSKCV